MRKKPIFLLLCCLLALALLPGCGSGQQVAGHSSDGLEVSPPEQFMEEAHPGEEPIQTEVAAQEPEDYDSGEADLIPVVPQLPSMSVEQTEESIQPGNEATRPNIEPAAPPVPETPSEAPEPTEPAPGNTEEEYTGSEEEITEMKMTVQVGTSTFTATLEDNAAVRALVEMMENGPVTIQMSDYAGFEKVGTLETYLPTSNSQITTQAGDIVLYQGNQIVMFYGSNSWSYTRLGMIDNLTGWTEALGGGDISVTFFLGG